MTDETRAKSAALIGMMFRMNGQLCVVTQADSDFPNVVHYRMQSGHEGCILADFVRANLARGEQKP